jgi:photosystem II stability/assembly factor-like uncharacterized protein
MLLTAITASNILAIEALANPIINWLVIAQPILATLLVFAVGIYLGNIAFNLITKSGTYQSRLLGQAARLAVIALFATVALQQIWTAKDIVKGASGQAEVAISQNHRTNVFLGKTNVSLGGGGYVTGIYFHPLQQDLIYIKTDIGGFYRWNPVDKSWLPLTDHFPLDMNNYYGGEALALDPNNPKVVYIAAGKFTADWWPHRGTIFKSMDKGETWTKLSIDLKMGGNEDRREVGERLSVDPFNSNIIFFGSRQDGLWKSSDAGASWAKVTSFPGNPKKDIGITAIVFNKNQSGLVYAIAYEDGIYQSTDTGMSWSKIAASPTTAMRLATSSNSTLYVTSNSTPGVSKYSDGVWQNITPQGSNEAFNGLSVNPANPNDVLVCTQQTDKKTKIYRSLDGGATWTEQKKSMNNTVPWWSGLLVSNPAVSAIEFDPKVAGRVWLTDWYGIWRTDNINTKPAVWTNYEKGHEQVVSFALVAPPSGALLLSGVADVDGFNHNNGLDAYPSQTFGGSGPSLQDTYSIAYCETDPSRIVRVGGNRWNNTYTGAASTDGGLTWKQFASWQKNQMPLRVAVSATNPNVLVVTVSEGQALRTEDGGASWRKVSGLPNGVKGPWNWSQPLAADTVDGSVFYYYAGGKVYRSTDRGLSFESVNMSLKSEDWHSLKTFPGVKGEVWLSLNDKGLYRSTDSGQNFSQIPRVEQAHLFAFGKPHKGSTIPALYLYGKITGMGNGLFRSLDRGKTWTSIGDPKKPIGNGANTMEASKQEFGLVFVGTNGRGIYYGSQ